MRFATPVNPIVLPSSTRWAGMDVDAVGAGIESM
jgi:hypothetical protein